MLFKEAKKLVAENFDVLETSLEQAVTQGFLDDDAGYYNLLATLQEDAHIAQDWPQLNEIIYKGKTLEEEIDAWLSLKGYATMGLEWPTEAS